MLESMTGFGTGTATLEGVTAVVEIKSINSRYIEFSAKLPKSLSGHENEIKDLIRNELERGKITVFVQIERSQSQSLPIILDEKVTLQYKELLQQVIRISGIQDQVRLDHLIRFSDIWKSTEVDDQSEYEWEATHKALVIAIDQLKGMRRTEGETLTKDLIERILILKKFISEVKEMSEGRVKDEFLKLRDKVAKLIDSEKVDNERLEQEIAYLAERLDITEEIVRFNSHIDYFENAIKQNGAAGRKLNFLVQELNREINTISSKANHAGISQQVVSAKEELEKIREQLQNIE